jgi:hypothetical protein
MKAIIARAGKVAARAAEGKPQAPYNPRPMELLLVASLVLRNADARPASEVEKCGVRAAPERARR